MCSTLSTFLAQSIAPQVPVIWEKQQSEGQVFLCGVMSLTGCSRGLGSEYDLLADDERERSPLLFVLPISKPRNKESKTVGLV